ncbi:MAG: 2-oxoacid:acceptor oxidoreductase subunit alpha [Bacteroidales bacterium]|jgi:2-oxoglutarate ferredoxin oxidoreductase subunit alpha|nr:2-oxoacid:acceptor oxidoreductase subunit alpha [Bacteroidales bacterium]
MSKKTSKVIELDAVVVKFAGDSGDGMQLSGSQFSDTTAFAGNDLATFPDYPSEIRAPQGTIAGVSGFQLHIGHKEIDTPGDLADVLVALNPAALKTNMKWVKPGATIIIDIDNFDNKHYKKAGFIEDPLHDGTVEGYNVVKAPITQLSKASVKDLGIDAKSAERTKNQFALGILYWLFNKDLKYGEEFIDTKFGTKKPLLAEANKRVLRSGYNYAETVEALRTTYQINPIKNRKGKFRNITGNVATAWGLMAAAERAGMELFLGSYPITPASEILQELSGMKRFGVKTFQAEDEIAGINAAIGASFAGDFAVTTTSGPGLALKSEAIGLAVITELPIVIVDVQRGGPATGLPTKPEQADLMQALYGRNGESPCVVIAASTPANCFKYAYEASKIALEHMTPVILLTDGYLANGSELWNIPEIKDLAEINPPFVEDNTEYFPYKRNPETLARYWALPGQEGLRHRIGGLEKEDITGNVSHNPLNHEKMVLLREEKVQKVADFIPEVKVCGEESGDLLVVGWGGTYGALISAVKDLQDEGKKVSLAQFNYIKPLPRNTAEVFGKFKHIIVCEINLGQFANYLRMNLPQYNYHQYNKVQGLPFMISELKNMFNNFLEG